MPAYGPYKTYTSAPCGIESIIIPGFGVGDGDMVGVGDGDMVGVGDGIMVGDGVGDVFWDVLFLYIRYTTVANAKPIMI